MLFSNQALIAVLAGLTSVRAESSKPCLRKSDKLPAGYFELDSQECCGPEFAIRENDQVRCRKTAGTPASTEGIAECPWYYTPETSCEKGIKVSPKAFPQPGRCGAEEEGPVSGKAPDDKVGCYSGRLFVNGRKCCTKQYVVPDGNGGLRCGPEDMEIRGLFPADNLPPPHNDTTVPSCNGTLTPSWCPEGVLTTAAAIEIPDVCSGEGCCRDGWTRDQTRVCRHFTHEASHLAYWSNEKYFKERMTDGCPAPEKGEECCPEMMQFRNGNGVCSTRTTRGDIPKPGVLLNWRVDDHCHDYIYAVNNTLLHQALNATLSTEAAKEWRAAVEREERKEREEPRLNSEGRPIWE